MRDIRPAPRKPLDSSKGSGMPLPPQDELYEITEHPRRKRELRGASVPVTNVHVPTAGPAQEVARETKTRPARPLFAKASLPARPARARKVRLGKRETVTVLVLLAVVGVVALLGAVIFLPKAHVKLVLATAPLLVDQELAVRAVETDAATVVPGAGFFRQVGVEGTSAVTGTEIVGVKATGTVDIINRTNEEQKIRERSRLVTKDGVLFYMTRSATVPGEGRVSVPVEAAEAGEIGNIEPQRLDFAALDASGQTVTYAEATRPISGGSGEEIHVVTEQDIEAARGAAGEAAQAKVQDEIQAELPQGWVLLDESWAAEISDFTTDGQVGSKQPQLAYQGQATVRVLAYEAAVLEARLTAALESRLDENYALFPGPISFSKSLKSVDWDAGEGIVVARVTHTTIPDFSLETLKQKMARRSQDEAREYLEGLPGVRSVELNLSPFWVRSIPRIENRINLEVVPERQP